MFEVTVVVSPGRCPLCGREVAEGRGVRCRQRRDDEDARNMRPVPLGEQRRDRGAPVAACGAVAAVAEAGHQLGPGVGDPLDTPAAADRLVTEAVARQRRAQHMEGVAGGAPVGGRVGERAQNVQELDRATAGTATGRPATNHRLSRRRANGYAPDAGAGPRDRPQARPHETAPSVTSAASPAMLQLPPWTRQWVGRIAAGAERSMSAMFVVSHHNLAVRYRRWRATAGVGGRRADGSR